MRGQWRGGGAGGLASAAHRARGSGWEMRAERAALPRPLSPVPVFGPRPGLCAALCLFLMRSLLLALAAWPVFAAWQAGVGAVDISPAEPIWMAGYAARTRPSEGIRQPIHVK